MMNGKAGHLLGRIIASTTETSGRIKSKDRMIVLIDDLFVPLPGEKKTLEDLARKLLPEQAARLRGLDKAPRCDAQFVAEAADLREVVDRQRRARAKKHKPDAYRPLDAKEYEGLVDIAGRPNAPSSYGYLLIKDLSVRARLTDRQVHFAAKFFGHKLGVITVWPPGAASSRDFDLAEMWRKVRDRDLRPPRSNGGTDGKPQQISAVQWNMAHAINLLPEYVSKSNECAKLLAAADAAARSGATAKALELRNLATVAAVKADAILKKAKALSDAAYNNVRNRFWAEVHKNPDLVAHFEINMGLRFVSDGATGKRGAPFYELPGGKKEYLTLDHRQRRRDNPWLAVDEANLDVSPSFENSPMLELIRKYVSPRW